MWKRKVQYHLEHFMEDSLDERNIHDVVKALSSKMRSRRRKSVARLADLSQDSTNRELMVKDGALEPLIKLLERDDGEHQSHVLATLSSLASSHAYVRKELLAAGIVPATLPLLANDSSSKTQKGGHCEGKQFCRFAFSLTWQCVHRLLRTGAT